MKLDIHPTYYPDAKVTCACGNTFTTGSTLPEIKVDICSHCHPFFTGELRLIDIQGRIERFQEKQRRAARTKSSRKKAIERKSEDRPGSLKEMFSREIKKSKAKTSAQAQSSEE